MLNTKSLFDRIGGSYTINETVDLLYYRVLSDKILSPFFEGVCMDSQMGKMNTFLKIAFGGVSNITLLRMREAHKHFVVRGLSDVHLDRIIMHMRSALDEVGIEADLISEVVDIVNGYRDDVLGR